METLRLQKHLAACGIASRRAAETMISEGRITVNGKIATPGCQVDPEQDIILVDGNPILQEKLVYILLHKPLNVVSTVKDTHGRTTVLHCLKGVEERVYPVGRLDLDVSGVLLLTNDGELANKLIHPRYGVEKVYHALVKGRVLDESLRKLRRGVMLEDGMSAPAKAQVLHHRPNVTELQLTLCEGKKREVKRLCEAVGHRVVTLKRIKFGTLDVDGMKAGGWRYLTAEEIKQLHKITST